MRKLLLPLLAALIAAAVTTGLAAGGGSGSRDDGNNGGGHSDGERSAYTIGLWGDLPYSTVQATTGVPNLVADMNAQELAFTAHDGDLEQGSGSPCDDALYTQALAVLNSLRAPAAFTPGDNDWTDCDRPSNGGYSSLERLDHERQVLFATPFTLGQRRLRQEVQTTPQCLGVAGPVACVENRRWTLGGSPTRP